MSVSDTATPALVAFQRRPNIREEIIETLRGAVISGELRPRVVYSAPALAEQFSVSATPVREAMIDLAKEGLVEAVRNKGFRVTEPSEEELDHLTELRMLIEVPTVRRIVESGVDPERIAELRPLAEGIENAAAAHDLITHITMDMEFHTKLLSLAGNPQLVETVRSLRARSRIYGLKSLADRGQLVASAHEHTELLDLIDRYDAQGAEQLMRRHIGHVRGIWADKPSDPADPGRDADQ
ncbi:GntR family transcriptional regulator [Nocardia sp. NPDC051990]|uniref:GntR family transcriptional regulator n=1 Tax=Nocardia sp. NPDC051990 TaxID=3155285 RepID=UPI003422A31B